jgi:valine--pyruvate aminotransferase
MIPARSRFARRFGPGAGIAQLMDDLGQALSVNENMLMLGGGNPGQIPAMQAVFRDEMNRIMASNDAFERLIGNYGPPRGDARFIEALAGLLRGRFGWDLGPEHIALTNGSQSASFMLFNMLAGERDQGPASHILFPLVPEYIGYADQGLDPGLFRSQRPLIERGAPHRFKYRVDFDRLHLDERTAALCASRPTNPTGNVLTDEEVERLRSLARAHAVPLILDNAYGTPFPGIVFRPATPVWDESMIVCMSLSKLGLPGVRTGMVVAHPDVIDGLAAANAIINLTTGCFGPALTEELVRSRRILALSEQVIRPFYQRKAEAAVALLEEELAGYPWHCHEAEGAIFLWLWLEDLPVSARELYQRLKARDVLVIPGEHFFPGLPGPWKHTGESIRVTYSQDDAVVQEGLRRIAAEVRTLYDAAA